MANHASALKRARQNQTRRKRNIVYKTKIKSIVKDVRTAVTEKASAEAAVTLKKAVSMLHKSAGKGVIHRKKADRKISRLSRQVHQMASA